MAHGRTKYKLNCNPPVEVAVYLISSFGERCEKKTEKNQFWNGGSSIIRSKFNVTRNTTTVPIDGRRFRRNTTFACQISHEHTCTTCT